MKMFRKSQFNVIVLVPIVAIAMSESGGCSTTDQRAGPLTKEQIEEQVAGNTLRLADEEIYALVEKDGGLKGLNLPSGASEGRWRVSDNGVLCAEWDTPQGSSENCDVLGFFNPKIGYQWGGNSLILLPGNPKSL